MKLFLIKSIPDIGLCSIGPVLSPDGVRFDDYFDPDVPSPFDVDHGVAYIDEVQELGDRLVSIDADMVVSEAAKAVIERLAPRSYLSFLPMTVLSPEGEFMAEYYCALQRYEVDAIDYNRSEFEYFLSTPKEIRSVKKWAFDEARLPEFDLFRSKYHCWIGTEEARGAIEDAQLSGFEFELAWESDG